MTRQALAQYDHSRAVGLSIAAVIGMVLFVFFVLRPMYYWICEWTGITGSTFEETEAQSFTVDFDRPIRVQFLAMNNATMAWQFNPLQSEVTAHPGELVQVRYYARNSTGRDMVAQAVPSLAPFEATNYFLKTECFCFNQQPLSAGEETEMGLVFQIDPELPDWVKTITLTYSLFDITRAASPTDS